MTLSVITPSFGQLDWLVCCIQSVADQLGGHADAPERVEHIIQDGGSEGIEEFAREIGATFSRGDEVVFRQTRDSHDDRYHLAIHTEGDSGMYDAINRGVVRASGEIVAWLNCDEQYLPGALSLICAEFRRQPNTELLAGGAVIVEADGLYRCHRPGVAPTYTALIARALTVQSCAIFFRREIFARGFALDPTWRSIGDKEWFLRLLKGRVSIVDSGGYYAVYYETSENLSKDESVNSKERERLRQGCPEPPPWLDKLAWFGHKMRVACQFLFHFPPRSYSVYSKEQPVSRRTHRVTRPSLRWRRDR